MGDKKKITGITLAILLLSTAAIPLQINSEQGGDLKLIDSIIGEKILQNAYADQPEDKGPKEKDNQGILQKAIKTSMDEMKGKGTPTPATDYKTEAFAKGKDVTVKSNTILTFDNPQKYGKEKWGFDDVGTPEQIQGYIDYVNQQYFEKTGTHYFINDDDGDGLVDEDPVNGTDDDGDGLVDEDPVGLYDFETQPLAIFTREFSTSIFGTAPAICITVFEGVR